MHALSGMALMGVVWGWGVLERYGSGAGEI